MPELLRGQINPRTQEKQALQTFWASTNHGNSLKQHDVENAITVLVSPETINMDSVTFDTRHIKRIDFKDDWRGLLAENCDDKQHDRLPLLGDGGHRLDLLREFVYHDKLNVYAGIVQQIEKIDTTGKGKLSREPLVQELEKL
ncbi:hypothetical protein C0993_009257, partial [Termitomyces sp. T159_Od127]